MTLSLKPNQLKGASWAFLSALSFAALMILNKLATPVASAYHLPIPVIIWGRCFFAACFLLPFFRVEKLCYMWPTQIVRGLCAAAAMLCTYSAYSLLKLHEATILGTAGPLFIMVFAIFLLKEHINWHRWLILAMGFLGVIVIIVSKHYHAIHHQGVASPLSHILIMVGSNTFSALTIIAGRFLTLRGASSSNTLWYSTVVPMVIYSLSVAFFWVPLSLIQWQILFLLGLFGIGSAGSYLMALRYAPASFLAPFEYLRPCLLIPADFLLWGRVPTLWDYVGAFFIISASFWLTHLNRKEAFS